MAPPSKRLKTVDDRILASSSSSSSALKASSPASQGSEALESALISTLSKDPQACKLLLDTLDQTAGKADPMSTAAYDSDPIGTTGIRKARRACLTSFLAPALRSGSSSPAGSFNLGTASGGHWLDHNTLERMWTAVRLPGVFKPRFDAFCARVSAAIKQQERALREHIISGQDISTFRPRADYATNEFDFNSLVDRIARRYYPKGVPDAGNGFEHDHEALLRDVHFKPFVDKLVTALHKTFDLAVDPKNLTLYCAKGAKEVAAQLKDVKDDIPYFRRKLASITLEHGFNYPDEQDPKKASLAQTMLEQALSTYERPQTNLSTLSDQESQTVLCSTRNRFTRSVEDSDFRVVILLERRLNRLAAEEADHIASRQALDRDVGRGHIGGELFGVPINVQPSTQYTRAYKAFCSRVVKKLEYQLERVFHVAKQTSADTAGDMEGAASFMLASQRELVEGKNDKKGKGRAKTFDLEEEDVDPNVFDGASARAYGQDDGEDGEPNRTEDGTLLSKQMAYVCGFNVYSGPAMVMKHAEEEMRAAVDQYKHKTVHDPLPPSGASACGDDNKGEASADKELNVEEALSRVLNKILGELETVLKDEYALRLVASALFELYAPIVVNRHPSLSAALARLTRAKARVWQHDAELGHFGLELSKIIAFTSVLAFSLPTAGYSAFIADCFTHQLCSSAPSQRVQSIIQSVALDLQGFCINVEFYTTAHLHHANFTSAASESRNIDPRWIQYFIEFQGGDCWMRNVCSRKLVYRLDQRKGDNEDSRLLSIAQLQRRKPLPLNDGLPEGQHWDCVYSVTLYLFCLGYALSLMRVAVLVHYSDRASRGKAALNLIVASDGHGEQDEQ